MTYIARICEWDSMTMLDTVGGRTKADMRKAFVQWKRERGIRPNTHEYGLCDVTWTEHPPAPLYTAED